MYSVSVNHENLGAMRAYSGSSIAIGQISTAADTEKTCSFGRSVCAVFAGPLHFPSGDLYPRFGVDLKQSEQSSFSILRSIREYIISKYQAVSDFFNTEDGIDILAITVATLSTLAVIVTVFLLFSGIGALILLADAAVVLVLAVDAFILGGIMSLGLLKLFIFLSVFTFLFSYNLFIAIHENRNADEPHIFEFSFLPEYFNKLCNRISEPNHKISAEELSMLLVVLGLAADRANRYKQASIHLNQILQKDSKLAAKVISNLMIKNMELMDINKLKGASTVLGSIEEQEQLDGSYVLDDEIQPQFHDSAPIKRQTFTKLSLAMEAHYKLQRFLQLSMEKESEFFCSKMKAASAIDFAQSSSFMQTFQEKTRALQVHVFEEIKSVLLEFEAVTYDDASGSADHLNLKAIFDNKDTTEQRKILEKLFVPQFQPSLACPTVFAPAEANLDGVEINEWQKVWRQEAQRHLAADQLSRIANRLVRLHEMMSWLAVSSEEVGGTNALIEQLDAQFDAINYSDIWGRAQSLYYAGRQCILPLCEQSNLKYSYPHIVMQICKRFPFELIKNSSEAESMCIWHNKTIQEPTEDFKCPVSKSFVFDERGYSNMDVCLNVRDGFLYCRTSVDGLFREEAEYIHSPINRNVCLREHFINFKEVVNINCCLLSNLLPDFIGIYPQLNAGLDAHIRQVHSWFRE